MRFVFASILVCLSVGGCTQYQYEAQDAAGDVIKDCDECPELVVIPPGTFMMGSPQDEVGRSDAVEDDDEDNLAGPGGEKLPVTIDYYFAVGRTEVTWDNWDACVAEGGCDGASVEEAGGAEGFGKGNRPVMNLLWKDMKDYVSWISKRTGKEYRLPSEAEWEYAARAGTTTRYSFGDDITKDDAQYDAPRSAPVASFQPNAFGLYDVHGNVWERVEDCYTPSHASNPANGSPVAAFEGCERVWKGGAWNLEPRALRSANRNRSEIVHRGSKFGFRVARTLD